jgi:hypothetical protein
MGRHGHRHCGPLGGRLERASVGRLLQRLLVWLAFAGAFLAPMLARAALIPTCDAHDQLSRMPAPTDADAADAGPPAACSFAALAAQAAADEELGDPRAAAMCDPRGASILAPQRVLPIADARLDAVPCHDGADDGSAPTIGAGSDHPPLSGPTVALAQHAVLDTALLIPPPGEEPAPPFPPAPGGPRAGFDKGIDHPPR